MKTVIAYATKSGTTEICAAMLQSEIYGADLVNLDEDSPDLELYDTVLIGGPIRYGSIHHAVRSFCKENIDILLTKNVGLFICCGSNEASGQYFKNSFPPNLLSHAFEKQSFGGEFRLEQLPLFEKWVIKMIAQGKKHEGKPAIDSLAIHTFAEAAAHLQQQTTSQ